MTCVRVVLAAISQTILPMTIKQNGKSLRAGIPSADASDGERERATVLICHLAGTSAFETISDWYTGVKRTDLSRFRLDV